MKNNNQQMLITVLVVIIIAIIAFFGGMQYAKKKVVAQNTSQAQFARGQMMNRNGANGRARFGGLTLGQVVAVDQTSITVKLSDGSSKIINLTNSTTYSKMDTATKSDIATGVKVAVMGATNSDGSISATNIELNPPQRMGQGMKGTAVPSK